MTKSQNFFQCPVCGAEVPPSASACPECGADDTTGWNADRARYDGLDLPDDEFDYDEYLNKEFGDAGKPAKKPWPWLWIVGAVLGLLALSLVLLT
ncbi:MAG: zinc-ribbon domain-containing protein [Kiritimatiellaeota bacterium]|nr:zinc-ribbon domain-containing protein [Kiritimatiellota bacterium]